jgi:hypothetical protein
MKKVITLFTIFILASCSGEKSYECGIFTYTMNANKDKLEQKWSQYSEMYYKDSEDTLFITFRNSKGDEMYYQKKTKDFIGC